MTTVCRSFALAFLLAALVGCGKGDTRPASRFISIATGGSGGVYYPYGGGLAKILNEKLPDVRATAEVTAASVDNLKLIRDGRADIAFTLADTLADAVAGRGPFDGRAGPGRQPRRALLQLHADRDARQFRHPAASRDLRGHTVSTGSPGSGTEVTAVRLLSAAGLDPDRDVRRQGLGASESADALKDGKIDAFFWSGGLPTAAVQDLSHTPGITMRLVPSGDLIPALRQALRRSLFRRSQIPAGAYPGVDRAGAGRRRRERAGRERAMPDDLAYDITRLLFEHQPELAAIHPEARNLSLDDCGEGIARAVSPGRAALVSREGQSTPVAAPTTRRPIRRAVAALPARLATALAIGLSLYSLYWVLFVVQPQVYRVSFLLVALVLTFLVPPDSAGGGAGAADWQRATIDGRDRRGSALDWLLPVRRSSRSPGRSSISSASSIAPPIRCRVDVVLGAVTVLLVLEAARRSVGWILPVTAARLPRLRDGRSLVRSHRPAAARASRLSDRSADRHALHDARGHVRRAARRRGDLHHPVHDLRRGARAVGRGHVLHQLGAAADGEVAVGRRARPHRHARRLSARHGLGQRRGDDRDAGSVSWPLLRRAGYRPAVGGAILSAAGIGAMLSPPTLGAAAFLIAEFLQISYLQVLVMATVPTLLYYLSIFLMIEADSRRLGTAADRGAPPSAWALTKQLRLSLHVAGGDRASSWCSGMSAFRAVFWATVLAVGLSFLRRETALTPRAAAGGARDRRDRRARRRAPRPPPPASSSASSR